MADNLTVAFREFDRNGDGSISVQELKDGLANILAKSINEEQALKIMSIFDKSGDGAIQLDEFRGVEEFRNKLDRILQDEKDAAFIAKREASAAKLAAEKAEAVAELINNRPPTRADRILAGLPYLFPLLDALPYGRVIIEQFHLQYNPIFAVFALLFTIYQSVPFSGLIAFFSLNVLTNNLRLNRLVRFNIQQAILLDISLIFPGILGSVVAFAAKGLGFSVPAEVANAASSALFLTFVGLFLYGVGTSWLGVEGDGIPFISERVKQRVPTTKEFMSMFDEEGNFRPPKPPPAGSKPAQKLPTKQTQDKIDNTRKGDKMSPNAKDASRDDKEST